ncbi:MAG: hypothetical protein WDM96_01810 [Lacunisphaera sp.]
MVLALASAFVVAFVSARSAEPAPEIPPPWAYGFKEPAPAIAPVPAPAAKATPPPPDPTRYGLPGTDLKFTRAEITALFAPADFLSRRSPHTAGHRFPRQGNRSCGPARAATTPTARAGPKTPASPGLPVDYFIEQLQAFRAGERATSDHRKPNTRMMVDYATAMTDDEIRAAAEYYGAMKWTPWIRVVEATRVPKTTLSAGMYLQAPEGGDEPLGDRIIEVPENPDAVEITRSPRVGFIAYVPVGSVKRGESLVVTGDGKTLACAACHGADLQGRNDGRSRYRCPDSPDVHPAISCASSST